MRFHVFATYIGLPEVKGNCGSDVQEFLVERVDNRNVDTMMPIPGYFQFMSYYCHEAQFHKLMPVDNCTKIHIHLAHTFIVVLSPRTLLQWIQDFTFGFGLLLNLLSIQNSRNNNPLQYQIISTRTNYYKYSFSPHAVVLWNSLPYTVVNAGSLDQFTLNN